MALGLRGGGGVEREREVGAHLVNSFPAFATMTLQSQSENPPECFKLRREESGGPVTVNGRNSLSS